MDLNMDISKIQAALTIAGVVIFAFVFLKMMRRTDPLPDRDPSCIWHSAVTQLDRVYDGDTFYAHVKGHDPINKKPIGIRIRGIDAPEIKDTRPAIQKKAAQAKEFAESQLRRARKIHLYNISMDDKYGRMLATVFCDRKDLARMLVVKKLAKSYDGGKKPNW
jgi:endonuclease YncB( thermonuclease family)